MRAIDDTVTDMAQRYRNVAGIWQRTGRRMVGSCLRGVQPWRGLRTRVATNLVKASLFCCRGDHRKDMPQRESALLCRKGRMRNVFDFVPGRARDWVIPGLFAVLLTMSAGVASSEHSASPSLAQFQKRSQKIMSQVEAGTIPEAVGPPVKDLSLSVRKRLIHIQARIDSLKLEIGETSGDRQERAIQALIATSAQRERLLLEAVRRLNALARDTASGVPAATLPRESATPHPEDEAAEPSKKGSTSRSITIQMEPSDMTEPQYME